MSETNKKTAAQDLAIHEYLQSLLLEVPDDTELIEENATAVTEIAAPETDQAPKKVKPEKVKPEELIPEIVKPQTIEKPVAEPEVKPLVVGLEQLVAQVPEVISQTEVVSESKVELAVETETEVEVSTQLEPTQETQSGVPEWAETRFQCLLFKVSGLSLAVPLVKLNSVIPWDENITETPNQTDWYLGLVQHLQNQVKVIDTALLVMPENRRASLKNDTENRLSHILLVDDFKWGLACSSIGDVIWLNQEEVKWRKNKTSRAWLSGTSLEHLCAIMDTEVFAQMLTNTG